ncbi:MAG: hypothetical protein IJG07_07360, partial [Prevotella sp.]|nr:hypothetical protein [Prevotella sp.]
MDEVDVAVEQLDILLTIEGGYSSRSVALFDMQLKGLGLYRLILSGACIKISILNGRNIKVTLMAGYCQIVLDDGAIQSLGGQFCIIGHLGIVTVEILG